MRLFLWFSNTVRLEKNAEVEYIRFKKTKKRHLAVFFLRVVIHHKLEMTWKKVVQKPNFFEFSDHHRENEKQLQIACRKRTFTLWLWRQLTVVSPSGKDHTERASPEQSGRKSQKKRKCIHFLTWKKTLPKGFFFSKRHFFSMIPKSKVSQKMELIQHQNVKENPSCQNHWRLE